MISIVTVTFNNLAGLKKTFESVALQDVDLFEWIVIDGGSQDGTVDFLKNCSRSVKFLSESDAGIYDAMHKGLKLARGDYLIFLNAGDSFLESSAISYMTRLLCGADVYFFACRMSGLGASYLRNPRPLKTASYSVPAVQQATVYKVSVLKKLDWPSNYKICGDFAIAAQLLNKNADAVCNDYVLAGFELGGVSTSRPMILAIEAYKIQSRILNMPFLIKISHFGRRLLIGCCVFIAYRVRTFLNKLG